MEKRARLLVGCLALSLPGASFAQVPEIDQLGPNEEIPASVFTRYDSDKIARSLVKRIHLRVDSLAPPNSNFPVPVSPKQALQIRMRIHPDAVTKILATGFLNQYDTGTSSGLNNPEFRYRTEASWTKLPKRESVYALGSAAQRSLHDSLPKYGYVVSPSAPEAMSDLQKIDHYGRIIAVFKPTLQDRTSFHYGDSLDEKFDGDFKTFAAPQLHWTAHRIYAEAQIWGKLSVKDVQEFLVPSDLDPVVRKTLERSGVPVSAYDPAPDSWELSCYEPRAHKNFANGSAPAAPSIDLKTRKAILEVVLARGEEDAFKFLTNCLFASPEKKKVAELMAFAITKGNARFRAILKDKAFGEDFKGQAPYDLLKQANDIEDAAERRAFLAKHAGVFAGFDRPQTPANDPAVESPLESRH